MIALLLASTVFAAPDWPTEWLGEDGSGFIEFEYRVTVACEIELMSFRANPAGLSREDAVRYLKNIILSNEKSVDWDRVIDAVPGVNKEDALDNSHPLAEDQFLAFDKAAEDLGPWPETRFIMVGGKLLVCELDLHGELVRASFHEDEEDVTPLSSLPQQEFRLNFEHD